MLGSENVRGGAAAVVLGALALVLGGGSVWLTAASRVPHSLECRYRQYHTPSYYSTTTNYYCYDTTAATMAPSGAPFTNHAATTLLLLLLYSKG